MYPDTDSPPTPVTRERVERLRAGLSERPWEREARWSAAGIPTSATHFLIRRGGATLVDRLVAEAGAGVREAAFFAAEKLKALSRDRVPVEKVPAERWAELFRLFAARPVLRQAWKVIAGRIAAEPQREAAAVVAELGLGEAPPLWNETLAPLLVMARSTVYDGDEGRLSRHATGLVMATLRGKVDAREVIAALEPLLAPHGGAR